MNSKYLKILEFDKILNMAIEYASCEETKVNILNIQPIDTAQEANYELNIVDLLSAVIIRRGYPGTNNIGISIKDVVIRASRGGMLSMSELLLAAKTLKNYRILNEWYTSLGDEGAPFEEMFYSLCANFPLEQRIFDSIISENEMSDKASSELYDIRRKIRTTENSIKEKLEHIVKSSSSSKYLQDAVVTIRSGRYVVPVKAEHKGDVSGVIHDVSSSGSTIFIEPSAVVEANAKILQLRNQEKSEIERILSELSDILAAFEQIFMSSYDTMLAIDLRIAKARLAIKLDATKPTVVEGYKFRLTKARHPLIEKSKVVAIDLELGFDYDSMVITGPNTGGKTVSLKTAGLLLTMAAYGFLISAKENSIVSLYENILVDIGDEQSIEQSLSTFSGHIKNITGILQAASHGSLVLLDELGAGTDPAEGAALAIAIIEKLRALGAKSMSTTHYGELKIFALETIGVENASCEFNIETLAPTYKVIMGVPGRSNAFLISEKLGISKEILQNAQLHLSAEDKRFETVIAQLDILKNEIKNDKEQIEYLKIAAEKELLAAADKREALIKQGELELGVAREKAKSVVGEISQKAIILLDELKELSRQEKISNAQKAARTKEILNREAERLYSDADIVNSPAISFTALTECKVGDNVMLMELKKICKVISVDNNKKTAEIVSGSMKTRVPFSKLSAVSKNYTIPKNAFIKRKESSFTVGEGPRTEINLLGKNVGEALDLVDDFIDKAVLSGIATLSIIHGKGTGALRSGITLHLKNHPNVKGYRLGRYGEGESGVTIVEIK